MVHLAPEVVQMGLSWLEPAMEGHHGDSKESLIYFCASCSLCLDSETEAFLIVIGKGTVSKVPMGSYKLSLWCDQDA